MDWFGVEEDGVKDLLFPEFQYLPVLNCSDSPISSTNSITGPEIELQNYPNPFSDATRIRFYGDGDWLRLSAFNAMGHELQVLAEGRFSAGPHEVAFSGCFKKNNTLIVG